MTFQKFCLLMSLCLFGCSLAGCPQGGSSGANTMPPSDLFRLHCSSCHGDGTGNGHVAATLKIKPRNLKHKDWQTSVTDSHIARVIRRGGADVALSPEMPAFEEKLTEAQIYQLVSYLRRLGM